MKLNKKSIVWLIVGLLIGYFVIDLSINWDKNLKDFIAGYKDATEECGNNSPE